MSSTSRLRATLVAAIVGIALYAALDALAQSLPPHYSAISQAESDLAVGPFGYIMTINFINRGVLSIIFLVGFSRAVKPSKGFRVGYFLVGLWAVGSMVLAVFPTDVSGSPTVHGTIHLIVAILAFLGGAFGELELSRSLQKEQPTDGLGSVAVTVAVLALASLAALFLGPAVAPRALQNVGGLIERIFIGLVLSWMLVVSAGLLSAKASVGRL